MLNKYMVLSKLLLLKRGIFRLQINLLRGIHCERDNRSRIWLGEKKAGCVKLIAVSNKDIKGLMMSTVVSSVSSPLRQK